ncbi:hypothetical protein JZ751_018408 [Albula glossodonta]|uniref:Ferric-chelate reductase 1 n=1 Tax=Albula glossodonta TaxID=121402 RepID=A0A8T2MUI2_9TELE|nr:hypothetical protein JZ751_018408 [Albula glossodonta]
MDSRLILVVSMVIGCLALAVRGDSHNSNSSMDHNMTTASAMHQNISVGELTVAITRDACGRTKLCEEIPADCNPAVAGSCFFVSASRELTRRGTDLAFELRGESSGYIAMILSPDTQQGNDDAFICAQQNGSVSFFTAIFNGSALMLSNRSAVQDVLASVSQGVIRCTFVALDLNATTASTRQAHLNFQISLASGTFNGVNLGTPNISLTSKILNIGNSTSNLSPAGGNNGTTDGTAGLHSTTLASLVILSAMMQRLF